MLRRLYGCVVRLHPPRFRDRFGAEMLSIFDEAAAPHAKSALVADGLVSIFRQWVFRHEYAGESVAEAAHCSSGGAPVFFIIDEYRPRTGPLIWGGVLTLALFCAAWLLSEYTWTHPVFMPLTTVQFETPSDSAPEGSSSRSPLPLATIPSSERARAPRGAATSSMSTPIERAPSSPRNASTVPPSMAAPVAKPQTAAPVLNGNLQTKTETVPTGVPLRGVPTATVAEDGPLSYVGGYTVEGMSGAEIVVTAENGQLAIQFDGEPKAKLVSTGGANFIFADSKNSWVKFLKDESGSAREIQISRNGREFRALRKSK